VNYDLLNSRRPIPKYRVPTKLHDPLGKFVRTKISCPNGCGDVHIVERNGVVYLYGSLQNIVSREGGIYVLECSCLSCENWATQEDDDIDNFAVVAGAAGAT
jgi:hypothetical protein